jgi:hypothetical protein
MPIILECFNYVFVPVISKFQAYIKVTHFELILYRVRDRDLVSVSYIWISSFPNIIC